jgi:hypothetical protein
VAMSMPFSGDSGALRFAVSARIGQGGGARLHPRERDPVVGHREQPSGRWAVTCITPRRAPRPVDVPLWRAPFSFMMAGHRLPPIGGRDGT